MNYFTRDMSAFLAAQSFGQYREQEEAARQEQYTKLRDFFEGGEQFRSYIAKYANEQANEYGGRSQRAANFNYFAELANQLISALYGTPPERVFTGSESEKTFCADYYRLSQMDRKKQLTAQSMVVLGDGFEKIWYDEEDEPEYEDHPALRLRVSVMGPDPIYPIVRPDDCERLKALIESRTYVDWDAKSGKQEPRAKFYLWTAKDWKEINASGGERSAAPHKYGVIPFAHYPSRRVIGSYLSAPMLYDALTICQAVNSTASMWLNLIWMQSHGQLVLATDREIKDVISGENRFIKIASGDSVQYINPNAEIEAVRAALEWLVTKAFEIGGVPVSVIRGGSASSGYQLALEFHSMTNVVNALKTNAIAGEQDTFDRLKRVGSAHKITGFGKAELDVRFPKTFLPNDRITEFDHDLAMLNNNPPLMTVETFVDRWYADKSQDERKRIVDDLTNAGIAKKESARPAFSFLGMNRKTPMGAPLDEEAASE